MNVANVFNTRATPRDDVSRAETSRPDSARYETSRAQATRQDATRADRSARSDRRPRADRASGADDDTTVKARRNPTREEFASLLALISGAGESVRADLMKQLPADSASLIETLLDGSSEDAMALLEQSTVQSSVNASSLSADTVRDAADALRYGILNDVRSGAALERAAGDVGQGDALGTRDLLRTPLSSTEHDHAKDILRRISTRYGTSVDQLKALGENDVADTKLAIDALLARAGTPSGIELAGAADVAAMDAAAVAAATAAANALAKANAASAADITTPIRDTDALVPALRERLDRVMARMKSEYGHDVNIVETARSQERQDHLYEQGRTRAGSVVTWTRDSAHTHGEAVDVIVDGSWNNAEGFARLQRIAREEGLRTLGVRDPGHLELADRGASGSASLRGEANAARAAAATPLIATAAAQSGVARVAGVAGVAQVAEPGRARGIDSNYTPLVSVGAAAYGAAGERSAGSGSGTSGNGDAQSGASHDARASRTAAREHATGNEANAFGALGGTAPNVVSGAATSPTTPAPSGATGATQAERVADVQQLRDSAPAGAVSRLTLDVDAPNGGTDRITIDLRGATVGTQISTDAANAERLRLRTAELQDALGRHGLESDNVRISGTTTKDAVDAARVVTGDRDGMRLNAAQQSSANDGSMSQGQRERSANAREWDRPEASRQSRDEQRESARQGAGQRGQRGTSNGSGT